MAEPRHFAAVVRECFAKPVDWFVALDDVVALEIGKDSLQPALQKHPELVKAISSQVMQRRDHLESLMEEAVEEEEQSLLSRIRSYFGL